MPTIIASAIINKAKIIVQDTTSVRWLDAEWLGWLNSGQREVVIIRPSAYTKLGNIPIVAGTKQTLPADAVEFVEYIRHMGAAGATPGIVARKVPRRLLDSQRPTWHSDAGAAAPQHYCYEPEAPKNFYIYPQAIGASFAEVIYSASPPDVAAVGNTISLDDIYEPILLDYIVYRAYLKDTEFAGNAERAILFRKSFEGALGLKAKSTAETVAADAIKG